MNTATSFKHVAQTNNIQGFEDLWEASNTAMSDLDALRWACAFDRDEMINCVLSTPGVLKKVDLTVVFKESVAHKSSNAIGRVLRWCEWNNGFKQEDFGLTSSKYLTAIGYAALDSDWSGVFAAQKVRFQTLSYVDLNHLHAHAIKVGAVECLKIFDQGLSLTNWSDAIRAAVAHRQSRSVTYLCESVAGLGKKDHKDVLLELLHGLVTRSYLFNDETVECAVALMEFVSVDELRNKYPRLSEPKFNTVVENLTVLHQHKMLSAVAQKASTNSETANKRKM